MAGYCSLSSNSIQNHRRWRDTYQAGDRDGSGGHTLYPVQSRTQSGTFNQYDYKNTNFKKEFNITKKPKDLPKKPGSDSENSDEEDDKTAKPVPHSSNQVQKQPSYGLRFNDEEGSDENEQYNYANDDALFMQQASTGFQDDSLNMFQGMKSAKKKKRKRKRKNPEGEDAPELTQEQASLREQAKKEWEAVKQLPSGSGELKADNSDEEQSSGMSGRAKWGKKNNKKLMKVAHIPMAPLLFQKAKGVLGDASLEKNENKPFEEMSSEERARKVKFLAKEEEDAQVEYQSWKRDYTSWFVDTFTMRGLLNGQDPIELLKKTEVDGFKDVDRAVQDEAAKIRQYFLTFKIVDMKTKKCQKDLEKFKKKLSESAKSVEQ
ncbi:Oidioi.mRNA.OKI2018_I69.XSR.g14631.t1.cds [Oikopleura dioica]|uniref:Oidioi.mRNA.OKI2018_I69.XSR.g14631.t1.cds n=1 Tax=Oikopleura dioica TaxID=34765 RepID=A0ABN7SAD3_OIKDI|nr:Oidioi.mRNA.OKI2018_I69.XSR.g14631.t1.cds [Oikopleura dioica]